MSFFHEIVLFWERKEVRGEMSPTENVIDCNTPGQIHFLVSRMGMMLNMPIYINMKSLKKARKR